MPTWLRDYRRDWLRPDVIAGLTAAAVVIPQALAYAAVAGLPVQVGLYTAFLPMVIYAWLGTSRPLSVSTTATLAILTGAALESVAPQGAAAESLAALPALTLLVGAGLILGTLLRLGFVGDLDLPLLPHARDIGLPGLAHAADERVRAAEQKHVRP